MALLPFVSFAQIKGDITIEWLENKEMSYGDYKITIPQFIGNSFHYDNSNKTLFFSLKINHFV